MDNSVYSAMQTGTPLASFRKACLGKIQVKILDPFSDQVVDLILKGDPKNPATDQEEITVDLWTEKALVFFKRINKKQFEAGNLVEINREKERAFELEKTTLNNLTDEEIVKLVNSPFMTLRHALNQMTVSTAVKRVLDIAIEQDRSTKVIKAIEQRLAEVQAEE